MLVEILPFIHKFIEDMAKKKIDLRYVILYGSFAEGNASPDSDVDLKIRVGSKNDIRLVKEIERDINKNMFKEGYKNYLSSMVSTEEDVEHAENGILLWGSPIKVTAGERGLKPKTIITYDTTPLPQVKRSELARRLFGYNVNRGNKSYSFSGAFVGKRLRNALLLEAKDARGIVEILKELNLLFESFEAFIPENFKLIEKRRR